jgi:uncharacterized protein DUF1488
MRLASTGLPAHTSARGIRFAMLNGPHFVHILVTYAALDGIEGQNKEVADYVARFAGRRDSLEQIANDKYARGQIEDDGSIAVRPGDV